MQWFETQFGGAWLREFHAYSPLHAVTVGACALVIALACAIGRRSPEARERRVRLALGWSIVAFQLFAAVWRLLPAQFDLNESLPLHLCRIVVWAAALSLLTDSRRARTLCFFWGLGLSTQGFITPMWNHGVASVEFWMFWVSHAQIAGAAVYCLSVLGYRPTRSDLLIASVTGVLVAGGVFTLNMALGTNYSYLGAGQYENRCVVDLLGPWPWRAPVMVAGAVAIFGLLYGASVAVRSVVRVARRGPMAGRVTEAA